MRVMVTFINSKYLFGALLYGLTQANNVRFIRLRMQSERSLRLHMARHTETVESCELCGKATPNRRALQKHMDYVHGAAKMKCMLCGKAFKKAVELKVNYFLICLAAI